MDGQALEWRTYKGRLSEKQQKAKERLQKRERTIANLRAEIERINAKSGQDGGLSAGQQAQVTRNEQKIEELEAEIDVEGAASRRRPSRPRSHS